MASNSNREVHNKGEESESAVFKTVLFYSLNVILAPVATFFIGQFLLKSFLGVNEQTSNLWGAILAVVVLHITLGLFIYRSFNPVSKDTKRD